MPSTSRSRSSAPTPRTAVPDTSPGSAGPRPALPRSDALLIEAALALLRADGAVLLSSGPPLAVIDATGVEEDLLDEILGRLGRDERFPQTVGRTLVALLPLRANRSLVITYAGRTELRPRDRRALDLFAALLLGGGAGGAAAGVEEGRLLESLQWQVERLTLLNQVAMTTSRIEDLVDASEEALRLILRALPGVEMASVWLLDHDQPDLVRLASAGYPVDGHLINRMPLAAPTLLSQAARSGQSQILQVQAETELPEASREFIESNHIRTIVDTPMRAAQRVFGVISFACHWPREIEPEELAFLETLSGELGSALETAKLHERRDAEGQRLQTIIENLPEAIVIADAEGRVSVSNPAAEALWGHPPQKATLEELPQVYNLYNPDGRPVPWRETPLARSLLDGLPTSGRELRIHRPDGSEVPILSNCAPLRDSQGKVSGGVEVFQDITKLKELDRLKDDFINTVSHELRTPTTTIRGGALTLLRRGGSLDEATKRQLLRDMSEEAERLHILVEDLLSLSRSQAGMRLATEPIIPHRFVNHMILEMGSRVGDHPLTVLVPADLPMVEADPFCLEQIFRNLLENAVKFSPSGERIEIAAEARDDEVVFSVLDRGSGIPPKDLGRVFEPFYRSDEVVSAGAQGAGLGLAVCERFARMQGGGIWAEARPGGGTAFRFTVPSVGEPPGEGDFDEARG